MGGGERVGWCENVKGRGDERELGLGRRIGRSVEKRRNVNEGHGQATWSTRHWLGDNARKRVDEERGRGYASASAYHLITTTAAKGTKGGRRRRRRRR
jgi:hypothetical protein